MRHACLFSRYLSYISHLHEKSYFSLVLRLRDNVIDIGKVTSLERGRQHVKLTCADDPIFLHPCNKIPQPQCALNTQLQFHENLI